VSKRTSLVIVGDNAGSKLTKARQLGIKVVYQHQLRDEFPALPPTSEQQQKLLPE